MFTLKQVSGLCVVHLPRGILCLHSIRTDCSMYMHHSIACTCTPPLHAHALSLLPCMQVHASLACTCTLTPPLHASPCLPYMYVHPSLACTPPLHVHAPLTCMHPSLTCTCTPPLQAHALFRYKPVGEGTGEGFGGHRLKERVNTLCCTGTEEQG